MNVLPYRRNIITPLCGDSTQRGWNSRKDSVILHFQFSISKPFHNAFYEGFFFRRKQRFPAVNQRIAS